MSDYKTLLAQRVALEEAIASARREELASVIAQAKALIADYGLVAADVFPETPKSNRATVAPKYRDSMTGATWTGRGKPPAWIANKDRTPFLI